MVKELLLSIKPRHILVVGDLCIDRYTFGSVNRISPEAPVPVLHASREEHRPGMAGNAILNLLSLGQRVSALGRIASDYAGRTLTDALLAENVGLHGLLTQEGYQTPIKNRFIASNQQILRVDTESTEPLPGHLEHEIISTLPALLEGVDAVAISDYGKGFLTPTLLAALIQHARQRNIPTIVDPKGRAFARYALATVIKPNLQEAIDASNLSPCTPLPLIAATLLQQTGADHLMITRSEKGISLFSGDTHHYLPAEEREVRDVTGAGDTVLAVTTAAVANQIPIIQGAHLANLAASIAIQRFGCARISLQDLATLAG